MVILSTWLSKIRMRLKLVVEWRQGKNDNERVVETEPCAFECYSAAIFIKLKSKSIHIRLTRFSLQFCNS